MRLAYDFHMHSCLSPCGSDDMTPYNLVNMAKICGLKIIALTDHNSTGNCRAAIQAGKDAGVAVIPGMELNTAEEIHVICLFPDIDAADAFGAKIKENLPPIKNKPDIFGLQLYMDARDKILGAEENLLVMASFITIDEAPGLVRSFGGFCYPAHVDRQSFSITASFGIFPPELGFTCAEITPAGDETSAKQKYPELEKLRIIRSSDSHYLESMGEALDIIDLADCTAQSAVSYFQSLKAAAD